MKEIAVIASILACLLVFGICFGILSMIQGKPVGFVCLTLAAAAGIWAAVSRSPWLLALSWMVSIFCALFFRPDRRVSFQAVFLQELVRKRVKKSGKDVLCGLPEKKEEPKWQAPEDMDYRVYPLKNAALELLVPREGAADRVIYQIHGGGYVEGLTNARRDIGVRYARMCGCAAALLDYRVAPDAVYPAALCDAQDGWRQLLELGYLPGRIALAGDSAGGNLLFSLTLKLRDTGEKLPAALFAMAPLGDFGARGASYGFNLYRDCALGKPLDYLPASLEDPAKPVKFLYAGDADVDDPYLSPVKGELKGFPPIFFQTGTYDLLLSDTLELAANAKKAGCDMTIHLYEGLMHAYQFGPLWVPEVKASWKEAAAFLREKLEIGS